MTTPLATLTPPSPYNSVCLVEGLPNSLPKHNVLNISDLVLITATFDTYFCEEVSSERILRLLL